MCVSRKLSKILIPNLVTYGSSLHTFTPSPHFWLLMLGNWQLPIYQLSPRNRVVTVLSSDPSHPTPSSALMLCHGGRKKKRGGG